jgi:predicted dehydrogenase
MPDPILVGRNAEKVEALARTHGVTRWTTDLDAALVDRGDEVFFDAGTTQMRPALLLRAIAAGKHVYCEKPTATTLADALQVAAEAEKAGVRNGVVMDKLFLPGLLKLAMLKKSGYFGRLLTVRSEFGYWVFEGDLQPIQRPSWNYRAEEGGGIILDMLCHWRYVLDHLFGTVQSVSCLGATHIAERWNESGQVYKATAEDAAFSTFLLAGDVIASINSSWVTRVYRDDLVVFQVDGTHGSAVAGLTTCKVQPRVATPRPVWNPDQTQTRDFRADWQEIPETQTYGNGFRSQWQMFIRHVAEDAPWPYSLREGAKGLQLVEAAHASWRERRWIDIPDIADRWQERASPRLVAG